MCAKHFVTTLFQILLLVIINADKDNTIICQQILCQSEPRIDHIQPVGVETTIALSVLHHAVSVFIELSAARKVFLRALSKIVLIHEVVARVVGRVYVDHLDLAEIGLLQELQHFQIIALDIEIFGVVEVHAFLTAGAQSFGNGSVCKQDRLLLVRPCKLIPLLPTVHHLDSDLLHQHILVNGTNHLAVLVNRLRHGVREQLRQLSVILIGFVRRLHFQFIHYACPP